MFQHLNFRVNFADADYSNLLFPAHDRELLRALAGQVAQIAALPKMAARKQLWKDHNALKKTQPVLLCDPENGWNEIILDESILCQNSIARHWELNMRKQIYWGNRIDDDYVVEGIFNLPYVYRELPWRVKGKYDKQTLLKTAEGGKAYHIETVLDDYAHLENIQKPEIEIDHEKTNALLDIAKSIFGDLLDVRILTVWFWSFGLTDDLVFMRGLENMMYDFYDEPEGLHQVMDMLYRGTMDKLDFLEQNNLLALNNGGAFVGSGGMGFTDELPQQDFSGRTRTKDMWGLAESQVTSGVSPKLFEEFIFPYQKKLMERFGLTCYACCEPMDMRFDIVKQVKNLRRVSVSSWADPVMMSEKLAHNYVYSFKPSPTPLSVPVLDQHLARQDIKKILTIAKDNCLELVMKDNHTLGGNPDNLHNWIRIVREEIDKL